MQTTIKFTSPKQHQGTLYAVGAELTLDDATAAQYVTDGCAEFVKRDPPFERRYVEYLTTPAGRIEIFGATQERMLSALGRVPMSAGSLGNSISADPMRWWEQACHRSNGALLVGKNASVAGNRTQHIIDRMKTDWPKGTAPLCFHMECTNDFGDGATPLVPYATHAANVRTIIEYLLSVGTLPIVAFPPPRNSAPAGVAKMGLADYVVARNFGIPFIYPWRQFVDPVTGQMTSSAGSSDGIHPSYTAAATAATEAWAQLQPGGMLPLLPLSNTGGAGQLASNCLFLTDSNADGLADGVVSYGDASVANSLSAAASPAVGNWQVMQANGSALHVWEFSFPTTGIQAGDELLLALRLKIEMLSAGAQCTVKLTQYSGSVEKTTNITPGSNLQAMPETVIQRSITAASGLTGIVLSVSTNVASCRCSIAQRQLYNLSDAIR